MLSERDQRTLADIERELTATDPRLAAKLARWQTRTAQRRRGYAAATFVIMLLVISFAAGLWWLFGVLMAFATAWSTYFLTRRWLASRRH